MARLRVTSGVLTVEPADGGAGPDNTLPGGGYPDNSLPGQQPGIDNALPMPPPGVFPPLTPAHPIQPAPPGTPPGTIWPPLWASHPPHPSHGLPSSPGHPSQGLPPSPGYPSGQPVPPPTGETLPEEGGQPDQGLPPKTYWVIAGIPGIGWRYVAVDPSLSAGNALPPTGTPKG